MSVLGSGSRISFSFWQSILEEQMEKLMQGFWVKYRKASLVVKFLTKYTLRCFFGKETIIGEFFSYSVWEVFFFCLVVFFLKKKTPGFWSLQQTIHINDWAKPRKFRIFNSWYLFQKLWWLFSFLRACKSIFLFSRSI